MKSFFAILCVALLHCVPSKVQTPKSTPEAPHQLLLQPETATEPAPASFRARFVTTKGDFVISATRAWSPLGVDRFYNLVKRGYYDNVAVFRPIKGFIIQLGVSGSPAVNQKWRTAFLKDDPVVKPAKRGTVTFAHAGPNTRNTQFFINLADNVTLDKQNFVTFGEVVQGLDVIERFNAEYGDGPPAGSGPDQFRYLDEGNAYLDREFPRLDYIRLATIE
jgi:peptidyl-prolyl cis-trans isomerase A (cyclophilin A)